MTLRAVYSPPFAQRYRPNGEIGRRRRLKISRPKGRPGSSPGSGTTIHAGSRKFARNVISANDQFFSAIHLAGVIFFPFRFLVYCSVMTHGCVPELIPPFRISPLDSALSVSAFA